MKKMKDIFLGSLEDGKASERASGEPLKAYGRHYFPFFILLYKV